MNYYLIGILQIICIKQPIKGGMLLNKPNHIIPYKTSEKEYKRHSLGLARGHKY